MSIDFPSALAHAIASHAALPEFEGELTLDDGYRLQHQVTAARAGDRIGGIKAGVTAAPMQAFFELDHALIGSLYADSRHESGVVLPYVEGRNVECEVAIFVDGEGKPKAIAPAIEIVLVKFGRPTDLSAANLVACNLGADAYVVGEPLPWDSRFNDARVTLMRDGDVVNEAAMRDALDGPEKGAAWMWKEAAERGFQRGEDFLFLGGACGSVVPGEAGGYRADYGDLGKIEFSIQPSV